MVVMEETLVTALDRSTDSYAGSRAEACSAWDRDTGMLGGNEGEGLDPK